MEHKKASSSKHRAAASQNIASSLINVREPVATEPISEALFKGRTDVLHCVYALSSIECSKPKQHVVSPPRVVAASVSALLLATPGEKHLNVKQKEGALSASTSSHESL